MVEWNRAPDIFSNLPKNLSVIITIFLIIPIILGIFPGTDYNNLSSNVSGQTIDSIDFRQIQAGDQANISGDIPVHDGIIEKDEYQFDVYLGKDEYGLSWRLVNDTIYLGIKAKTKGWVALGIEPTLMMKEADMIFGWVDASNQPHVLDCYATGKTGPHPPDTELGGTSDFEGYNATEKNGWTVVEFSRKLNTGDKFDKSIMTVRRAITACQ